MRCCTDDGADPSRSGARGGTVVARTGAIVVLLALAAWSSDRWSGSGRSDRGLPMEEVLVPGDALAREFAPSYPRELLGDGSVREVELRAVRRTVEIAPGARIEAWTYEETVPGPILRVRAGQTLRVRFRNELEVPTTIHWHGIRLPNAMDGVPFVTQPPVEPGGTFVYEFVPRDPGTFWYHPHVRSHEQVERGLHGVLVVEDAEPTPFSRELVWVLDDWRLLPDGGLDERFMTRGDLAHDGRWGNLVTVNGWNDPLVPVRPGERLRIRMVNAANGRVFVPRFERLDPVLIAADGMYLPAPAGDVAVEMAPGNRLDYDLVVPDAPQGEVFEVRDGFSRGHSRLLRLVLEGPPIKAPEGPAPVGFVPEWEGADNVPPSHTFHLDARGGGPHGIEWTINDHAMIHADPADGDRMHDGRYRLPLGAFARLRFVNHTARLHPIHLHGHFFRLLSRNGAPVEERRWRDTVLIHGREVIEIGLVPVEKGSWMMHCHVLEHADAGMMTLLEVSSGAAEASHDSPATQDPVSRGVEPW